jgi:putative membrane-bound dehydrogenase-like protein
MFMDTKPVLRSGLLLCLAALPLRAVSAGEAAPLTGPATEKRFPPLKVPLGFAATLFACDPMVEYPSAIAAGPRAGVVFVAIDYVSGLGVDIVRRDKIRLVEDVDGDGYADKASVYASGFNSIQGLEFHDGTLFVMHAPFLSALRDGNGDGVAEDRRDLLSGLGLPPEQNPSRLHCANGVVAGHDGWLYLALGDHGCDVARPEGDRLVFHGGGILRCRADGRDLHVFSSGLRNIYDIALDEELNVFVRDNENDGGDYLVRVDHSFFGADHGYPYLYAERPEEALPSLAVLGRGSSAGGLCYRETGFPADYRGNLFFCEWGRAVMRYRAERSASTFAPVRQIEFAAGGDNDPYGFKPTDLVAQRDGSLIVADWADGQQPKRGRGRLYRIAATGQPQPAHDQGDPVGMGVGGEIARLNSEGLAERVDAQVRIERHGREVLSALGDAVRRGRVGVRGRLHAVWILAHLGGPSAIDQLLELVRSEPDPRVQAQAVRAVADLADPVLASHRLAAGPGDADLAARLAGLADGRDPRVVLELTIAVSRLRWTGAPGWLHQTLRRPDPALAHASVQAMRHSANWPALLALLDEPDTDPTRALSLRAVADRAEPEIVDGLIARLNREQNPDRRCQYADRLTRVYKKPAPWVYWGYRPAARPANTVTWERTAAIAEALDRALSDTDEAIRLAVLRRMLREKVATRLTTLRRWLRARPAPETMAAIIESLRDHSPAERLDLLADVISDRSNTTANRLEAVALWSVGSDETADSSLLKLAGSLEDGPVLAAALRHITKGSVPQATSLLVRKLSSPVPNVREAAIEVSAAFRVAGVEERTRELLADGDRNVRRAAAAAVRTSGLKTAVAQLLNIARDPDPGVRRACLDSLRRLREPRSVPLAVAALSDRDTQLAALACLSDLGGPAQGEAVADLAVRSPTAEILPLALRILTTWSRDPSRSPAQRRALDQAVAGVQGTTGLMARWEMSAPLPPETAASLVARSGPSVQPFEPPTGNAGRWQTLFATGTEARLKVKSDELSKAGSVRMGYTDFTLSESTTALFLASSNGKLRVWADGRNIYQRAESQPFQPDSDRFQTDLAKGSHRLTLELASASSLAEFHLRFRRKSSSVEHEQLVKVALARAGDPQRGRKVFENVEKSLCLKCHRVADRGERIGPELSGIGGRFSRITIIESILEPSRSIAPGFESVTVALADGRVFSGVRVAETERALTIGDQEGRAHTIARADIEALARQARSTMPDGLEKRLTPDDFVDLIAYLAGQK